MKKISRTMFLSLTGGAALVGPAYSVQAALLGGTPDTLGGVALFPPNSPWNTRIDGLPVDPQSPQIIANHGNANIIAELGMPYNIVPGSQRKTSVTFDVPGESDRGPYPIPPNPKIENGPYSHDPSADHHLLILDTGEKKLYELYQARPLKSGGWHASSGAIFDLTSNRLRPDCWTSSDAAGLPVLPGLLRYDEVVSGAINHALRFTLSVTRQAFVHPATHLTYSGPNTPGWAPMGARFRLKASVNISNFSRPLQVILTCLKRYGMFVADNGTPYGITATDDPRWVSSGISPYSSGFYIFDKNGRYISGNDFEVVTLGVLHTKC